MITVKVNVQIGFGRMETAFFLVPLMLLGIAVG